MSDMKECITNGQLKVSEVGLRSYELVNFRDSSLLSI